MEAFERHNSASYARAKETAVTQGEAYQFLEAYEHKEVEASAFNGSWEELMRAIAAGAATTECGSALVAACAQIAGPEWIDVVLSAWGMVAQRNELALANDSELVALLVRCGRAADEVELSRLAN
jgi:hypothetical protein